MGVKVIPAFHQAGRLSQPGLCLEYHEGNKKLTNPLRFSQITFVLGRWNVVKIVLRIANWLNHFRLGFSGKQVLGVCSFS